MKKFLIALTILTSSTVVIGCKSNNTEDVIKNIELPALRAKTQAEVESALKALNVKYVINGTGLFSHYGKGLSAGDTVDSNTVVSLFFSPNIVAEDTEGGDIAGQTTYPSISENPSNVMVKYIDLGAVDGTKTQGESHYIKIGTIDILVDGGQYAEDTALITKTLDENMEDNTIEYLISTHDHEDHMGGYRHFLSKYDLDVVIEPNYMRTTIDWIPSYRNIVNSKNANVCKYTEVLVNTNTNCRKKYQLAPSVSITFLSTGSETINDSNQSSVVFVLDAFGTRFLFNGDSEKNQEAIYAPQAGKIDFLKAAHHGTKNGNTSFLMNAVQPKNVIITNGTILNNSNGHPTDSAVNNVYAYNNKTNIYATTGGCGPTGNSKHRCDGASITNAVAIDRNVQRNGDITVNVSSSGHSISGSRTGTQLIELSQTTFWKNHSGRTHKHYLANY